MNWLKCIGVAANPLVNDWYAKRPDNLKITRFSQRPTITTGDKLVYYAVGTGCICAVMQVTSSPAEGGEFPDYWPAESRKRWPWYVKVSAALLIDADNCAPTLDDVGVKKSSVRRRSHLKLTNEQYDAAVAAIRKVELHSPRPAKIDMAP